MSAEGKEKINNVVGEMRGEARMQRYDKDIKMRILVPTTTSAIIEPTSATALVRRVRTGVLRVGLRRVVASVLVTIIPTLRGRCNRTHSLVGGGLEAWAGRVVRSTRCSVL